MGVTCWQKDPGSKFLLPEGFRSFSRSGDTPPPLDNENTPLEVCKKVVDPPSKWWFWVFLRPFLGHFVLFSLWPHLKIKRWFWPPPLNILRKKLLKMKISEISLKYLLNKRSSKGKEIKYKSLETAEYLKPFSQNFKKEKYFP